MTMTRDQKTVRALYEELRRSPRHKFPARGRTLDAPDGCGVYVIYNSQGNVAHVGRTPRARGGIAQRLRDHLAGRSSFVRKELKGQPSKLRRGYAYSCLEVEIEKHRAWLEAFAIGAMCPKHIGTG